MCYDNVMPIQRSLNHEFFSQWNPDMAYVLGFFAADGSMLHNTRGACFIEFTITDLALLRDIRRTLESNHKITMRTRTERTKPQYRLQIGSKKLFDDLRKIGFTQAKSKTMLLPPIPSLYFADFVRGYFDGDGCVYFKKHFAKDRGKPRWVFNSRFTSGSKKFLMQLHRRLAGITHKGAISTKMKGDVISGYELIFSHTDSLALFDFMYNNDSCRLYLKRKHRLFVKAVKTLYPSGCSSTG